MVFVLVGLALSAGILVPLASAVRDRRWGVLRRPVSVAPSPYRGDVVHEERARRAPGIVFFASGLSVTWGVITLLLFAPAGCLLSLLVSEMPLFVIGMMPIVLHGFIIAVRLVSAGSALVKRDLDGIPSVVRWSIAHHIAVAIYFAIGGATLHPREPLLGLLPAIPAAIGLLVALLLRAGRAAALERRAAP